MFAGFMVNAWLSATIVAVVGGAVGFFVVLRGAAFQAHAIPNGAFAGAAGANLIGVNPLIGLAVFSLGAALGIGALGRRGRSDVVTALALVLLLALGGLFLSRSTEYEPQVFSLLFGEVLGVSSTELVPLGCLGALCVAAIVVVFRPLMLSSVLAEVAEARGIRTDRLQTAFLVVVALATATTVPVVGALLIFALMVGPPAAARSFTSQPMVAMALSIGLALVAVWAAIASSYLTNWPVGFFVGTFGAALYGAGRGWALLMRRRPASRHALV
jgi:zinc/manganese transport system permease protein